MGDQYLVTALNCRARCEDCEWQDGRVFPDLGPDILAWAKSLATEHIKQTGHKVIVWEKTRLSGVGK